MYVGVVRVFVGLQRRVRVCCVCVVLSVARAYDSITWPVRFALYVFVIEN